MFLLIITTLIWAFSFSFIGIYLTGHVDVWFSIVTRIGLAFLVFLPFLKIKGITLQQCTCLMLLGSIQLSLMYSCYYYAFFYLSVPEVLLFTITTPIYITLFYDLLRKQSIRLEYMFSALLSVIGAAIIRYDQISTHFWFGLLLIQCANICFAIGQIGYKYFMERNTIPQHNAFAWFYAGAALVAVMLWLVIGNTQQLPTTSLQWGILIWLGIVASGAGYFMWNYGATQVDAGTLAIMNNIVIPIGILVNVLFWHQSVQWGSFILGTLIIVSALVIHQKRIRTLQK